MARLRERGLIHFVIVTFDCIRAYPVIRLINLYEVPRLDPIETDQTEALHPFFSYFYFYSSDLQRGHKILRYFGDFWRFLLEFRRISFANFQTRRNLKILDRVELRIVFSRIVRAWNFTVLLKNSFSNF